MDSQNKREPDYGITPEKLKEQMLKVEKVLDEMVAHAKAIEPDEARKLARCYLLLAGITRATLMGKIYCPKHLTEGRTVHLPCGCDVHDLEKLIASRLGLGKIPGWD